MTLLTFEQEQERLEALATSYTNRGAAERLGISYQTLYSWVKTKHLMPLLGRHRYRMRAAHQRGVVDGQPWKNVGIELGVSARWAEHLAGLYSQRRKRAA